MAMCVSPDDLRAALEKLLASYLGEPKAGSSRSSEDECSSCSSRSPLAEEDSAQALRQSSRLASFCESQELEETCSLEPLDPHASECHDSEEAADRRADRRVRFADRGASQARNPPSLAGREARPNTASRLAGFSSRQLVRTSVSLNDRNSNAAAPPETSWSCYGSWRELESSCAELDESGDANIMSLDLTFLVVDGSREASQEDAKGGVVKVETEASPRGLAQSAPPHPS